MLELLHKFGCPRMSQEHNKMIQFELVLEMLDFYCCILRLVLC